MKRIVPLATLALLCATGCYYDNGEELYGPQCDLTTAGFNEKILPIIQANCQNSGCHAAGSDNGQLLTYENVRLFVDDNGAFRNAVVVTRSMPQGGALSACELDLIEKWLDAGALND